MSWEPGIAPNAIHPGNTFHQGNDVLGDDHMQFRPWISLPDRPQRREQMNRVAKKPQVEDHDFPGDAGALPKTCRITNFAHSLLTCQVAGVLQAQTDGTISLTIRGDGQENAQLNVR